jgi:hypothetical protein
MAKKFDKDLYNTCDPKGKQVALLLMNHYGYKLKDDSEAYKERDIIVTKDGKDIWVEAECSPSWKSKHWPQSWDMTCPYRKADSKASLYIRTNANLTSAIVVPMSTVHSSPVIIKDTIYTKNEKFFNTSFSDCDFFDLSDPDKTKNRYILS